MVWLSTSPEARDGVRALRHSTSSTQLLRGSASDLASDASALSPIGPEPLSLPRVAHPPVATEPAPQRFKMPRPPPPPSAARHGTKPPADLLAAVALLEMLPPAMSEACPHTCGLAMTTSMPAVLIGNKHENVAFA